MEVGMITIEAKNLSEAWLLAYENCIKAPKRNIAPLSVSFNVTDEEDWNPNIKNFLNNALENENKISVETVRNTIFPENIWKTVNKDRNKLFGMYLQMWPKIKMTQQNHLGLYFHRLIAYPNGEEPVNQLEKIIRIWQSGNHRKSALQASIFYPVKDLSSSRQRGFPCLQQLAFHPIGSNGRDGMSIIAFYASQHCFEKAFGNFWGLQCLGKFMAQEMGLQLKRVCCIASNFELGGRLVELQPLTKKLKPYFSSQD